MTRWTNEAKRTSFTACDYFIHGIAYGSGRRTGNVK
jgi:hypothetical protein